MRHFIDIDDVTDSELEEILELSEKENLDAVLERQSVALLFQKPSTRTRHSSEAAVVQLGGHPVYTRPEEIGIDERETAEDIAKTLSGYHSIIAARVFQHSILERMAAASKVPVINLLSDSSHPIQTLADLLTIRQVFGKLNGINIAYIGDANNVAYSLAVGANMCGANFVISHPEVYGFDTNTQEQFISKKIEIHSVSNPVDVIKDADVIYTDAWYSMGQEDEKEIRTQAFKNHQINEMLMKQAKYNAIFMHCLPAHRGYEVTDEVLDGHQSKIWEQAENRMHTMRGLLYFLKNNG
ncbi:MAG: ornithine carbamoyltransferase [Acidimicrobiia bacterium]